jgi:hypothetical protein
VEGVALSKRMQRLWDEIRRMKHNDSGCIEWSYLAQAYSDGAVDLLCCLFIGQRQLVVLVSQDLFQFLQLEVVAVHEQLSLLFAVPLAVGRPDGWFVVAEEEVAVGQDACLLEAVGLDGVVGESADHDAAVDVVDLIDLGHDALTDCLRVQEVVVLVAEEQSHVDEAEVVLVGQRSSESSSLLLLVALDAHHHLGVAVLEVLDEESKRVFRPREQQSFGEFGEERAQLVLLAVGLHILVSLEGFFSVHCSYTTNACSRRLNTKSSSPVLLQTTEDSTLVLLLRLLLLLLLLPFIS